MMESGIYCITSTINNKLYIGSAINLTKRKREHFNYLKNNTHHSRYLQRSYNKHGENNFEFKVLLYCVKKDLLFYEQLVIDLYDFKKELYNLSPTAGNNLGVKYSRKSREKLRKANLGKKMSEESKKKISIAMQNPSEETREKMRQNNLGKKLSDETKRKISKGNKGSKNAWYGKKFSKEYKKKLSEARINSPNVKRRTPVKAFCFKTGNFVGKYKTISECANKLKLQQSAISRVLNNQYKQTKGYTFKKVEI